MFDVTSSFTSLAAEKNAAWSRKLYIGSSDYSSYVIQWPVISRNWDTVSPSDITVELANDNKAFNFFLADGTKLHSECSLKMGFAASSEYITVMAGTVDAVSYRENKCAVTLIDKFKKLTDRVIGDNSSAYDYTGSSYLVHDLAWYVCTSHGGLSATVSSANTDIDYQSFSSWTAAFSVDNVRMKGSFTGQTAAEALKKIANLTQSAIWVENNKLKFSRFTITDSSRATYDESVTIDGTQLLDERSLVNTIYVNANYNVTSRSYSIRVVETSSSSISRYGVKEAAYGEKNVWFVDSVSALNLAQRRIKTGEEILPEYTVTLPLNSLPVTIGDTITLQDAHLSTNDEYRVMKETLHMDSGKKVVVVDQTQIYTPFTLDVSALDGFDVLT